MTMSKVLKEYQQLLSNLLQLMSVQAEVVVSEDKANEAWLFNIQADEETGLLIGNRGETLYALQYLLGIIYRQKVGAWQRMVVNVGDYREKQEDYLKQLAFQALERLQETGQPQFLYSLTPGQRRVVHLALSTEKGIVTESEGEGSERCLVIKKAE